jgi:cytoskeleton protein RodZ
VSAIETGQNSPSPESEGGAASPLAEVRSAELPAGEVASVDLLPDGLSNADIAPAHPGLMLRTARERLGLSLADIAQATKFGMRQIEALEQNDVQRLPPATFVRGMLRGYARRVALDPQPLLAAYEAVSQSRLPVLPQAVVKPVTFPEGQNRSTRNTLLWSLALLVAMVAVLLEWQFGSEWWGTELAPVASVQPANVRNGEGGSELALPLSPSMELVHDGLAAGSAGNAPAGSASTAAVGAAAPVRSTLQLEFQGRSWVEIRERDGRVIFSQDNPAGSRSSVEGLLPLTLTIGNAAAVKLLWLDKPIDLKPHLGASGVAQLVLQ